MVRRVLSVPPGATPRGMPARGPRGGGRVQVLFGVKHQPASYTPNRASRKKNSARSLRPRRLRGECFWEQIHRRDAEPAEVTQRENTFPTDSNGLPVLGGPGLRGKDYGQRGRRWLS